MQTNPTSPLPAVFPSPWQEEEWMRIDEVRYIMELVLEQPQVRVLGWE